MQKSRSLIRSGIRVGLIAALLTKCSADLSNSYVYTGLEQIITSDLAKKESICDKLAYLESQFTSYDSLYARSNVVSGYFVFPGALKLIKDKYSTLSDNFEINCNK